MSRAGNTYGGLTVLDDRGSMLFCRCACGREGLYPSAISKPSYGRRRKCAYCAGRPCEVCGKWIEAKAGQQSPTCSEFCRKKRAARRESDRYYQVKDSPEWKAVRAAYLEAIKARVEGDPEFLDIYRSYRRKIQADHVARLALDPAQREAFLHKKRAVAAAWRERLRANPALHAQHLADARAWYHSLSPEDRERIFYAPHRARMAAKKADS